MSFFYDNFTDTPSTLLINHTSNSNGRYTPHPQYSSASARYLTTGSRVRGNAVTFNIFNINQPAEGPDHAMTCLIFVASTGSTDTGLLRRQVERTPRRVRAQRGALPQAQRRPGFSVRDRRSRGGVALAAAWGICL